MAVLGATLGSGCSTCSFYRQAVVGQYRIVVNRRPIDKVLADPQAPSELKDKLRLALRLRAFAATNLGLPVNGHYERYVEVGRRYVVWNVSAAPPFSLEAKTWWYPFVGRLEYRGYFSEAGATRYARKLEQRGWEVFIEGVEAYSTLGWFRDPVLSTFIHQRETALAETLFHELAHQRVFVGGDTDFDEAFATTVGTEGVRRWLRARGDASAMEEYRVAGQRHQDFVRLVTAARQQLRRAYGEEVPAEKARGAKAPTPAGLPQTKAQILSDLRRDYAALKRQWGGYAGYDEWFAGPLNNAQLNTVATYYDWVPAFQHLLRQHDGDLVQFYQAVDQLARLSKKQRQRRMADLLRAALTNPA